MAEQLDDAEFWLPAEFLTDDDMGAEKVSFNGKKGGDNKAELFIPSHEGFPTEFPYEYDSFDSSSALSSPVESVVGSTTETESSDEDEFLAALTRRLAHSTSQKLTVPAFSLDKKEKSGNLASSPQSTLSGLGSWSASGNGSPNGPSQVPSPPTTPFGAQNDTWDLIYAAAGQVARLKMSNEAPKYTTFNHGRSLPRPQAHAFVKNSSPGVYSNQSLPYNLPQPNQYQQHARQEQLLARQVKASNWQAQLQQQQQQIQSRTRSNNSVVGVGVGVGVRTTTTLGLPQSSWPPLQVQSRQQQQQQPQHNSGSGMRAMFLGGGSGTVKRECAGTGVFLPRRYGNNSTTNPPEPRKKSGCSTVLLPAKVVQALNLNFDDTNAHVQPHFTSNFASNYDALIARRNAVMISQAARRSYRAEGGCLNHEVHLPQEWTY